MKGTLGNSLEAKKYRFKRRSAKVGPEVAKTLAVITAAAGLGLVLVYGYNFAICSSYFQLKETAVRGCVRISEGKVMELAGIMPTMNILTANLERMASGIRANPWVKEAHVGRELPDRLVVEIVERTPVALVRRDKHFYLVDREGTLFKIADRKENVDLPLLTGMCTAGTVNADLMKGALALLEYSSKSGLYPKPEDISEIRGDSIYGYTVFTMDRHLLKLGFGQYDKKLRRLKKVLFDLSAKDPGRTFLSINLMESDRIIVQRSGGIDIPPPSARRRTSI